MFILKYGKYIDTFLLKKCELLLHCISYLHFCSKNISLFENTIATKVTCLSLTACYKANNALNNWVQMYYSKILLCLALRVKISADDILV